MDPTAYYFMRHFKPGTLVHWNQQRETVSHVVIRRNAMMVYLVGNDTAVHPDALQLEPSAFQLSRVPDQV